MAFDAVQAYLDAYFPNGAAAQKSSPHRVSEFLDEGAFSFESDTSSRVLDVVGGSMNVGAAVQLYTSIDTIAPFNIHIVFADWRNVLR